MSKYVLRQTADYVPGTAFVANTTNGASLLPTRTNDTKRPTSFLELFSYYEPAQGVVAKPAAKTTATASSAASRATSAADNFKGQLNLPPDVVNQVQNTVSSVLGTPAGAAVSGLLGAVISGGGQALGALINLTQTTATSSDFLLNQAKPKIIPAAQRLIALLGPGARIPGMPGAPTDSSSTNLEELLRQSEQFVSEVTSLAPQVEGIAKDLADKLAPEAAKIEAILDSDQLKQVATQEFSRIKAIATAKNTAVATLGSTGNIVQAIGGAASVATAFLPVAAKLAGVGGAALGEVLKNSNQVESAITGFANSASKIVDITAKVEKAITELEPEIAAVVSQAQAQTAALIKTLPIPTEALSQIDPIAVSSLKEKLAIGNMANSGQLKYVSGALAKEAANALVEFQGLAQGIANVIIDSRKNAAKDAAVNAATRVINI